jgi:hypothetical protein
VYVVQKQMNGWGSFVSVTVLGDAKGRGCVIIPEGRNVWGWRGVSHEIDHFLRPKTREQQGVNPRRPEGGNSTAEDHIRKEYHSFKEAVILGSNIPKVSHINTGVNIDLNQVGNSLVNGATEISLKIILGILHKNNWEVKWAGVVNGSSREPSSLQHQAQQAVKPSIINPTHGIVRTQLSLRYRLGPRPVGPLNMHQILTRFGDHV